LFKGSTARSLHSSQRFGVAPRAILLAANRPSMVSYGGVLAACSRGEAWILGSKKKRCNLPFGSVAMSGSG